MKVRDVLTLGFTWWMRGYDETIPTESEIEAVWAEYDRVKQANQSTVDDLTKSAVERLAAQRLIDRAHNNAVNMEFEHCC